MMGIKVARLFSMLLRLTALAGKFAVFIALAGFLGDIELGLYGLLAAAVAYGTFLSGLEYYNYSMREVAGNEEAVQSGAILNHISFVLFVQLVLLAVSLIGWATGLITFELFLVTLAIAFMEQWAQEGYRLLVALSKPVVASVVLFLRQGAWVFFVIFCFYEFPEARTLQFVLLSWLTGAGLAGLVALSVLFRHSGLPNASVINRRWIARGLPVAIVFFGAALGLNTVNLLDRYFQAVLGSDEALAAYVLFFGISVALIALLDAGVFSFGFSKIVAAERSSTEDLIGELKKVLQQTILIIALFFIVAVFFFEFGLELFGISQYDAYPGLYYILMLSISLQALSMVPHLGLFALQQQKIILGGHLLTLALFVVFVYSLRGLEDTAVAAARAGAFLCLAFWKGGFLLHHLRRTG